MTSFDDLLSQVPVAQIAEKLGAYEGTASDAVKKAPAESRSPTAITCGPTSARPWRKRSSPTTPACGNQDP